MVGDLSFYNDELTANIVKRLKGIKYFVLGNHVKHCCDMEFSPIEFHEIKSLMGVSNLLDK